MLTDKNADKTAKQLMDDLCDSYDSETKELLLENGNTILIFIKEVCNKYQINEYLVKPFYKVQQLKGLRCKN